jgi:hypothetical protein
LALGPSRSSHTSIRNEFATHSIQNGAFSKNLISIIKLYYNTQTTTYRSFHHMSDYNRTFNHEAKIKLSQVINEGIKVLQEIEDLNAGLSDTVKAIAEELEIKPSVLKKAIKIANKSKLGEVNRDMEELNTILETVGRTL